MGEITDFFKGAQNTLRSFFTTLEEWDRKTSASLPGYINKVSVDGTVYMEQSIIDDDIALSLMGCGINIYVCWVLCALGLDAVCNDGRTVNERMRLVHGNQMLEDDLLSKIKADFGNGHATLKIDSGMEAVGPVGDVETQLSRLAVGRLVEFDFNTGMSSTTEISRYSQTGDDRTNISIKNPNDVRFDKDTNINYGDGSITARKGTKVDEIASSNSKGNSHDTSTQTTRPGSCKAWFYVMLHPFAIQSDTFKNFMQMNFVPTMSTRWKQVRAKEIAFWKDFIFARDLVEREAKLIKNDKSGLVAKMMSRQTSGVFRWVGGMLDLIPKSHNLSNSILVFDKQSFDMSCREAHIDFNNTYQRMQFFRKTFTMMVMVVDTMYGKVDMYYAGVPNVGNYTFNMINKFGSGKSDNDLKTIMSALAAGNAPRLF